MAREQGKKGKRHTYGICPADRLNKKKKLQKSNDLRMKRKKKNLMVHDTRTILFPQLIHSFVRSTKQDLLAQTLRHIPPLHLPMAGITPPPHLLTHLPRRHNIIHPLSRFQMSKHRPRHIPIHILYGLARGCKKRPHERCHGS